MGCGASSQVSTNKKTKNKKKTMAFISNNTSKQKPDNTSDYDTVSQNSLEIETVGKYYTPKLDPNLELVKKQRTSKWTVTVGLHSNSVYDSDVFDKINKNPIVSDIDPVVYLNNRYGDFSANNVHENTSKKVKDTKSPTKQYPSRTKSGKSTKSVVSLLSSAISKSKRTSQYKMAKRKKNKSKSAKSTTTTTTEDSQFHEICVGEVDKVDNRNPISPSSKDSLYYSNSKGSEYNSESLDLSDDSGSLSWCDSVENAVILVKPVDYNIKEDPSGSVNSLKINDSVDNTRSKRPKAAKIRKLAIFD